MAQSLEGAINYLQTKMLTLNGKDRANATIPIREAPAVGANEQMIQLPFSVVYEHEGVYEFKSAGFGNDIATIFCEIHCANQLLQNAIILAASFRDPFLKMLTTDPTLGGNVSNITALGKGIRRKFGRLEWGMTEHIGYRFEIDVKIQLTAS